MERQGENGDQGGEVSSREPRRQAAAEGSQGLRADAARAPLPDSHVSMATCGPCLRPGESGSDGGDLCAFRLAHYVGNEVKQPGGAFVLRGLPLSCQASVYL